MNGHIGRILWHLYPMILIIRSRGGPERMGPRPPPWVPINKILF